MSRYVNVKSVLCLLLVLHFSTISKAQDLSKYQALFITKFVDYIAWPSKADKTVIGVVGNSRVIPEMQKIVKSRNKNFQVVKISSAVEAARCQIVFIPVVSNKTFSSIKKAIGDKSVLIITETEALATQGSIITFYKEDNKLKFIVNKKEAEAKKLKLSSNLLSIAKVI